MKIYEKKKASRNKQLDLFEENFNILLWRLKH